MVVLYLVFHSLVMASRRHALYLPSAHDMGEKGGILCEEAVTITCLSECNKYCRAKN